MKIGYNGIIWNYEKKRVRKKIKNRRMAIFKTRRKPRYMDKRKVDGTNTETCRDKRKFSSFNLEEGPKSITIWKDGNDWLIYDQAHNAMTQGKSYRDAVFMLSDLLECKGIS